MWIDHRCLVWLLGKIPEAPTTSNYLLRKVGLVDFGWLVLTRARENTTSEHIFNHIHTFGLVGGPSDRFVMNGFWSD